MKAILLNNRYRILKTLGRGGFGETYLTEDTHMPSGRKCVVKQLKPIVKNPKSPKTPLWMKERFQREAAILEELGQDSEQIPQLYAYFSENDKFYLVQEWIEGLTLDQYWEREGNLHRDEVRQILIQLLPVLGYIHGCRIIHRDIKPENIILRQEDNLPFLIDFGAVKEAIATEVNEDSSSNYSASIGTPGYMASEQAAGRPIYSSDLYSLGLTAIFLLTGKSPHELETDPRNGEIIWRDLAENIDPELTDIIDKAIRFHPRDRFSSASQMLDALTEGVKPKSHSLTGATLNISPGSYSAGDNYSNGKVRTVALQPKRAKSAQKSNLLVTVSSFILIALAVAGGTFAAGFAIVSSLLRSPESPNQQAQVNSPRSQPDIFVNPEEEIDNQEDKNEAIAREGTEELETKKIPKILTDLREEAQQTSPNSEKNPDDKTPKTLTKVEVESVPEINIPILRTGTSESQLVSTLGKPNSERKGFRPNSRVLVYYDVVPDRVNLSYESDSTGKIRQTDVVLNSSVSLGTMQQTLSKMLGGNAPADVKVKLRDVYNRQTNFSFFKLNELEGKVQRDSKDRISISVWDRGFQ